MNLKDISPGGTLTIITSHCMRCMEGCRELGCHATYTLWFVATPKIRLQCCQHNAGGNANTACIEED